MVIISLMAKILVRAQSLREESSSLAAFCHLEYSCAQAYEKVLYYTVLHPQWEAGVIHGSRSHCRMLQEFLSPWAAQPWLQQCALTAWGTAALAARPLGWGAAGRAKLCLCAPSAHLAAVWRLLQSSSQAPSWSPLFAVLALSVTAEPAVMQKSSNAVILDVLVSFIFLLLIAVVLSPS